MIKDLIYRIIVSLKSRRCRFLTYLIKDKFYFFGKNVFVGCGVQFENMGSISLGDHSFINEYATVAVIDDHLKGAVVDIGSNVYIGKFSTVIGIENITIESNVLISDRCYIGDASHVLKNGDLSMYNSSVASGSISIGENSWIGTNVCILPNVKIGKHCIIGAGSVVTKDIEDFSVAVGNPAKIIKRVDIE